jgi:hypothetical protein
LIMRWTNATEPERIPTDRLESAREVVAAEVEHLRDASGRITIPLRVRVTTATRP